MGVDNGGAHLALDSYSDLGYACSLARRFEDTSKPLWLLSHSIYIDL